MTETNQSDYEFLWTQIKKLAQETISPIMYSTCISGLKAVDVIGSIIILETPSSSFANAIGGTLAERLKTAIQKANLGLTDFALKVEGEEGYAYNAPSDDIIEDDYVPVPIDAKFTFDSFVVGKCNDFAVSAAKAVAKNPAGAYNPLFIYGSSGLGKTHLLQSIANYVAQNKPTTRVLYTTSEKFLNEMVDSIYTGKSSQNSRTRGAEFRNRYRNVDILIVDDIQFLSKRQGLQEEFFHTFNELTAQNKQIVLSSDRPPKEIETLEERLKTRFDGGLTVDIQAPDLETKIAILKRKAFEKKCPVPDDVLNFIASGSGNDIRTLEGRLNKVIFASKLQEENISVDLASQAINQSVSEESEVLTVDLIINSVCSYYKIDKNDLIGKCKKKEVVTPRHICIYLVCELMNLPLVAIGESLGGRDHTTIIHAREKIKNSIKVNDKLTKEVNDIKNIILKQ